MSETNEIDIIIELNPVNPVRSKELVREGARPDESSKSVSARLGTNH